MALPVRGAPIESIFGSPSLAYVRTDADTHVYRCPRHGALLLPTDGRVRQQPAGNKCQEAGIADHVWSIEEIAGLLEG
jgi:hypothetical protein